MAMHLHLIMKTTSHSHIRKALRPRPSILGNWPGTSIQRMETSLISDHVGTNPMAISEWLSTHIWHGRNQSSHHDRMTHPLHITMEGPNPLTMSEWLTGSSIPLEGTSIWRTPSFSLKYSNFTLANGLVNTSVIYSSVVTYCSFTTPLCTISLI